MKRCALSVIILVAFASFLNFNLSIAHAVKWGSVVNWYYVSLREDPSRYYKKLAELPRGTWVHVYEDSFENGFLSVYYPDLQIRGWIYAKYLSW